MAGISGHPKALPFLFLTEMWERFGFYVVQGMLVLYMTQSFGFTDDKSYMILGVFTALAYIAPMVGGFLADKLLGFKQAILWGGIFLIVGYALLALPGDNIFYMALATIIVGNGLFKPNISSLLGALYSQDDSGRDSGFTIFYIGINMGILMAGLSSGLIKNHFGWHAGFALASLGLMIGLATFCIGLKWGNMQYKSEHFASSVSNNLFLKKPALIAYCFIAIGCVTLLLKSHLLGQWFLPALGIVLLFFVFMLANRQQERYRKSLYTLNVLIISSIVFWTIYLQMFFSANLFIDRLVDKHIFGFNIPTTAFYALESIFIVLLGPGLAWSWQSLNQNNRNPSPLLKFILAIVFVGMGYFFLAVSTYYPNELQQINPLWIVISYLMITIGEMLLSPIGLSAVTTLSPPNLTGMMMGIWFVALGFGGHFAGWLAKLASIPDSVKDSAGQMLIYRSAFFNFTKLALIVALVLFILQFFARRLMNRE